VRIVGNTAERRNVVQGDSPHDELRMVRVLNSGVQQHSLAPMVVLRFSEDEWAGLNESRGGTHTFPIARSYGLSVFGS
jgi:hypothetical protein